MKKIMYSIVLIFLTASVTYFVVAQKIASTSVVAPEEIVLDTIADRYETKEFVSEELGVRFRYQKNGSVEYSSADNRVYITYNNFSFKSPKGSNLIPFILEVDNGTDIPGGDWSLACRKSNRFASVYLQSCNYLNQDTTTMLLYQQIIFETLKEL